MITICIYDGNPVRVWSGLYSSSVVAFNMIQDRLVSNFVGVGRCNRNGQFWGGSHSAIIF